MAPYQLLAARRTLSERLTLEELRTLCFDLRLDYENLAGETKDLKIASFLTAVVQQNRLAELLLIGKKQRPDIPWDALDMPTPLLGLPPLQHVSLFTVMVMLALLMAGILTASGSSALLPSAQAPTTHPWTPAFEVVPNLLPDIDGYMVRRMAVTTDTIWMAVSTSQGEGAGLLAYNPARSTRSFYHARDGLHGDTITAIWAEGDDLWAGVADVGLVHGVRAGDSMRFTVVLAATPVILSIARDTRQHLWLGTSEGVIRQTLEPARWQRMPAITDICPTSEPADFPLEVPATALDSQRHVLWMASNQGLIRWQYRADTNAVTAECYSETDVPGDAPGLPSNALKALVLDHDGRPCVGTLEGAVGCFVAGSDTTTTRDDDVWQTRPLTPNGDIVQTLLALPHDMFIAGTSEGGLLRSQAPPDQWEPIPLGGPVGEVNTIVLGPDQRIWVATSRQCYRSARLAPP